MAKRFNRVMLLVNVVGYSHASMMKCIVVSAINI